MRSHSYSLSAQGMVTRSSEHVTAVTVPKMLHCSYNIYCENTSETVAKPKGVFLFFHPPLHYLLNVEVPPDHLMPHYTGSSSSSSI